MAPLPYTDSGARIALDVVLAVFVLLELRVRVRSRLNRSGSRSDRGSLVAVFVSLFAGMAGGFALAGNVQQAAIVHWRWPIFVVGLVLMVAGISIRQSAVAVLGRFFTIDVRVHPGQPVIERGPYRWVRHPSYTGLIMVLVGVGLALGTGRRWRYWPWCPPPGSSCASASRNAH